MMYFEPLPEQSVAICRLLNTPRCALFALPGTAGKTAMALSVLKIAREMNLRKKALIIAPLQTCLTTWPNEIAKWYQFSQTDFAVAHGNKKASAFSHDVVIINPDGIKWLYSNQELLEGFDTLFVDESTMFKNRVKRTKYLLKLLPRFARRHIMTGTPTPNSLLDWFMQQLIVDDGASFGKYITHFRRRWFYPVDYMQRNWEPKEGTAKELSLLAAPHVHTVSGTAKIPGVDFIDRRVALPNSAQKIYDKMRTKLVAEVREQRLLAKSKGTSYGKCRQIAAGGVYRKDKSFEVIHTTKWDVCEAIVNELQGSPVVVLYQFDFEINEMMRRLKKKKCAALNGHTKIKDREKVVAAWDRGEIEVLFLHPRAGAHGLNLQAGGRHMIWLTLPDGREPYEQANRRLRRLGASLGGIVIYRILVRNTVEVGVVDYRLRTRATRQDALLRYCEERSREGQKEQGETQESKSPAPALSKIALDDACPIFQQL